ncbi:hypothetical protein LOD99_13293 [Oopsacas minuta]|uniref:Uncharacterized protein n=1 Tax=Oopsacas minuta TaxID=111878 RepID=A0AAV7KML5_9METZ|nr:hypothetical protein LOD99_13291 [Oopsacas minuta]KAI6661421.1 hypothetical protein LOD99_13293 [Oopsacas minuta]
MYIGGIDIHTSTILSKIEQRKISLKERIELKIKKEKVEAESYNYFQIEDIEETDTQNDVEHVNTNSKPLSKSLSLRNTQTIPNIAMAAYRCGVSNRATAAIATGTLIDFGLITPEDQSLRTDKNKVARARQKYGNQIQHKEMVEVIDVTGIYFDGRDDKALSSITINGKCRTQTSVEEHIVVIDQKNRPNNLLWMLKHLTYLSPTELEVAKKVFQRNAFFSHLENVLLSILCDDEPRIRIEAVKRLLDLRDNQLSLAVGGKDDLPRVDICGKLISTNETVMPKNIRSFKS